MSKISRRNFLIGTGIGVGVTAAGILAYKMMEVEPKSQAAKVVIIGGGAGGLIAAKYIRILDPTLEVTLIEQNLAYYTCFMSNELFNGERTVESLKFSYDGLEKYGINFVYNQAIDIDPIARKVVLQNGKQLAYDRLIVSPGIDFKWDSIEGYDEAVIGKIPHAWKAGSQSLILRQQLEDMEDGGTLIITVPKKPFRCPTAPYERASLIAEYFKRNKPNSNILIFDANTVFPQQDLFMEGWEKLYGIKTENSLIEWIPSNEAGNLVRVNAKEMAIYVGEFEDEQKAEVINVIPPQKAGKIAFKAGLADDSGWCPVNLKTFESSLQKYIHVIGDACIASPMPKAAHAANSQAKVCALAVVSALQGKEMPEPSYANTCYSLIGENFGVSFTAVYHLEEGKLQYVEGAGGFSPLDASAEQRKREVAYAHSWYKNITNEMFN